MPSRPPPHRLIDTDVVRDGPRVRVSAGTWQAGARAPVLPCLVARVRHPEHDIDAMNRLRSEAQVLTVLQHTAGVPRLLHVAPGVLAQTRPPGLALTELPSEWLRTPATLLPIALRIAAVLERVHSARVIHAALHPLNVFYDASTRGVMLVGFNDAVLQSHVETDFAHASIASGVQPFSAPEQTGRLGRAIDYRADFHAFGALLHWALTGREPFDGADPLALLHALLAQRPARLDQLNPAVSSDLADVVAKLLAKQPEQRYQSSRGLRLDLERCLGLATRPLDEDGHFLTSTGSMPLAADDRRIRPAPPSRLFGRELALRRLEAALETHGGAPRIAMVRGYAGAGKSALVRALYPAVTARGGIVAAGRYDPERRLAPFTGLADALDQLADYWLADDAATLADTRTRLFANLGPNAAFLARVAPAFATLFWPGGSVPSAPDDGGDNLQRMKRALQGVTALVRERGTTLLLFIDDLQWADSNSLDLLVTLATDEAHAPLMLIGAYRDNEVDTAHPLTDRLQQIEDAGTAVIDLVVDGLGEAPLHALVADVLDAEPVDVRPLASALRQKTEGNPFFVLEYLRQLFDDGHLTRPQSRWRWDEAALQALPDSDNLVDGLLLHLSRLARPVQQLVGACAVLGDAIDLELLGAALGISDDRIDVLLLPLVQRDILMPGPLAPPTDDGAPPPRHLRFCHDRMQQAAHALLASQDLAQMHLAVARVLRERTAVANDFTLAQHYLAALPEVIDADERAEVFVLLVDAAERANAVGAFANAQRIAWSADARLRSVAAADPALGLRLLLVLYESQYRLARLDAADHTFARIRALADDDATLFGAAASRQLISLSTRSEYAAAFALVTTLMARLGFGMPTDEAWASTNAAELADFLDRFDTHGVAAFDALQPMQALVPRTLMQLLHGAVEASNELALPNLCLKLRMLELGLRHGRTVELPFAMVAMFQHLAWECDRLPSALALARAGLRMLARYPDTSANGLTMFSYLIAVGRPFDACRSIVATARRHRRALMEAGDAVNAAFYGFLTVPLTREIASNVAELRAELEAVREVARAAQSEELSIAILLEERFADAAVGRMQVPGLLDDEPVLLAEERKLAATPTNAHVVPQVRAMVAMLFARWDDMLRFSGAMPNTLPIYGALSRWTHAIALAHAMREAAPDVRAALAARLAPIVALLERHVAIAPINVKHSAHSLRAMCAWADGDTARAATEFDASIEHARQYGWTLYEALANEWSGRMHASIGATPAADRYLSAALQVFEAWGATGKVDQLEADFPRLRRARPSPGVPAPSADPHGIGPAAEVLAYHPDVAVRVRRLLDLVQRFAAVERGVLYRHDADTDTWLPHAAFGSGAHPIEPAAQHPVQPGAVPSSILNYMTQTRETVAVPDVPNHPRFGRDPTVQSLGVRSVIGVPVRRDGTPLGLLYLENRLAHTSLTPDQLDMLGRIAQHFAAALTRPPRPPDAAAGGMSSATAR